MKYINCSENVVPIGEFKAQAAQWIKKLNTTGDPLMITQNGKAAGIMISPEDYDYMIQKEKLFIAVAKGMADVEQGKIYTTEALLEDLDLKD